MMNGLILHFRGSRRRKKDHQMIILVDGFDNKEKALKLIGKTVTWTSPAKNELKGKISNTHGRKGAVRVQFEVGLPGQSLGEAVTVA